MACLTCRPFPLPKLHTMKYCSPPSHLAQVFLWGEPAAFVQASAPTDFPFFVIHTQHRSPACGKCCKTSSGLVLPRHLVTAQTTWGIDEKQAKPGGGCCKHWSLPRLKIKSAQEGTLHRVKKAVLLLLFCALHGMQAPGGFSWED